MSKHLHELAACVALVLLCPLGRDMEPLLSSLDDDKRRLFVGAWMTGVWLVMPTEGRLLMGETLLWHFATGSATPVPTVVRIVLENVGWIREA